eukprot:gene1025-biopygen5472
MLGTMPATATAAFAARTHSGADRVRGTETRAELVGEVVKCMMNMSVTNMRKVLSVICESLRLLQYRTIHTHNRSFRSVYRGAPRSTTLGVSIASNASLSVSIIPNPSLSVSIASNLSLSRGTVVELPALLPRLRRLWKAPAAAGFTDTTSAKECTCGGGGSVFCNF